MAQNKIGSPIRPLPTIRSQGEQKVDVGFILVALVLAVAGALAGWAVGH